MLPAPAAVRSNIHSVRCSLLKADTSLSVASSYPHPAFLPFRFYSPLLFHLCLPTHQPPPHRHMPTQLFLPLATCCSSVMASCCAIFYSSRVFLLSSLSKLLPFWKVYVLNQYFMMPQSQRTLTFLTSSIPLSTEAVNTGLNILRCSLLRGNLKMGTLQGR